MTHPDSGDEQARRDRRAWLLEHHPDRGGDPDTFAAGLSGFGPPPPIPTDRPRVTVARHRKIRRRVLAQIRGLLPGSPPRTPPRVK